ncbi:MAG: tyrosine--tRNA ligase [Candidatus Berkelbacteria bacterium]|nr:tyrosine--tRNA ligase [Candidatus Berkelbacteria bacterium]
MPDQKDLLIRGVEEIINKEILIEKIKSSRKLRIKLGIDPTAPDIHLGIAIALRKMAEFQKLGHKIIFLIGDFTAAIGDPSGANKTRPMLSKEEVEHNAKTYLEQAEKIVDIKKAEVRKNSEWYKKMSLAEYLNIKSNFSVQRILERDDFTNRIKEGKDLRCHEIDYPILQAYDSVVLRSDLEVGGTDQKFNMLAGRRLMEKSNIEPQEIMTLKILVGIDGVKKMSKSLGNYVGITEKPEEIYGKIMSIPDEQIMNYFELCTDIPLSEIKKIENPRDQKARLAYEIVKIYHGKDSAQRAEQEFKRVFREKLNPSEIEEVQLHGVWNIVDLLVNLKFAKSKSEATRLIEQCAVKINGKTEANRFLKIELKDRMIIQAGKRRFVRVKIK